MTEPSDPDWSGVERTGDVAALRAALAAAERRGAALAELTLLMSDARNPLTLAQRAVELTARATRAAGAFVYLWDRDEERLVLSVATEGWQRGHTGKIKLRVGEGITGWSALMRQTVVIPQDPQKDPRYRAFPELREGAFKSMVAVPIVAPGEEVLGVFSLYSLREEAFAATDVSLATEVGSLLANGLVQAETLGQLQAQSAGARFLRDLPDESWGSMDRCLDDMANRCAIDLNADVCVIEVTTDHARAQGTVTAVATTDEFREQNLAVLTESTVDKAALTQLLTSLSQFRLRIPLGAGAPIGALTCYRSRRFTQDDEVLLEGIGAQIAAGVLALYGTERLRPIQDQLLQAADAVTTEALLRRYGWSEQPLSPVLIRVLATGATAARDHDDDRVRTALQALFNDHDERTVLLGSGGRYLALTPLGDIGQRESLTERLVDFGRRPGLRVTAGIGPEAATPDEVHRAILHGQNASNWAELTGTSDASVVSYEDIAHLRLLPRTALTMSAHLKGLLDSLGAVVRYDLDNGTDLAQTLDVFLTNSGSVAKSSEELFIHRNTLRQRLQRIEELIGQSPEDFEDWVTAGVAVRLVRESESDLTRTVSQRPAARCPRGVLTIGRACCGLPVTCVHHASPTTAAPKS